MKIAWIALSALGILVVAALLLRDAPGSSPIFTFWLGLMGLTSESDRIVFALIILGALAGLFFLAPHRKTNK
jgi:hypothetical protein